MADKRMRDKPAGFRDDEEDEDGPPRTSRRRRDGEEPSGGELDSVRVYLSRIGCVDLLSREQEVEIARRIENAREGVLNGILATSAGVNAFVDLPRQVRRRHAA